MPYHVKHDRGNWLVISDATGRTMGTHPTKAEAEAQLRALYANVKK